jgi:hypothetical protein
MLREKRAISCVCLCVCVWEGWHVKGSISESVRLQSRSSRVSNKMIGRRRPPVLFYPHGLGNPCLINHLRPLWTTGVGKLSNMAAQQRLALQLITNERDRLLHGSYSLFRNTR